MSHAIYRAAELIVGAWVRLYLVGVPPEARTQRRAEIYSDLHEHRRYVQEQGRSPVGGALRLLVRCISGALDDLLWRSEEGGALGGTKMLRMMRAPVRVGLATGLILLVPLIAELTIDEMAWSPFDFAFVGVLLFGAGLTYELVTSKIGNVAYRYALGVALVGTFLLVFVNGAVGIIGSEDNPANAMYLVVLAVMVGGTLVARFQADGMARVLFATALAQALVAVIALIAGAIDPSLWGGATGTQQPSRVYQAFQIVGVNGMFIALFLGAASLFRAAGHGGATGGAAQEG